jgi:hypothetical protein
MNHNAHETVSIYFYTENVFPAATKRSDKLVYFHALESTEGAIEMFILGY